MRAFVAAVGRADPRALRRHRRQGSGGSATACRSTRLGLTEAQPENNVQRIVLEMLGRDPVQGRPGPGRAAAGLERGARAARGRGTSSGRCGCSRCSPSSPTCSSTTTCSPGRSSSRRKVAELVAGAQAEIARVQEMGGAVAGRRERLHEVGARGLARRCVGSGSRPARTSSSGVNRFETTEPNPLTADLDAAIQTRRPRRRGGRPSAAVRAWREARDADPERAGRPRPRARSGCAADAAHRRQPHAGLARVRPGRGHDGGVGRRRCASSSASTARPPASPARWASARASRGDALAARARARRRTGEELGEKLRVLVGKPGLDGHSNGAEQVAVRARDAGLRGRLPGHPADARADRRGRGGRGRAPRRHLDPVRLAHGARARGAARPARGGRRRRARHRRRDHPRVRRARRCGPPGWPRSSPPRTSGSTTSWARSSV